MTDQPQQPVDLDVCIIACNSERTIGRTLDSVVGLAERVILVDSGSTDSTLELASAHGAQIIAQQWQGYGRQKNFALAQCTAQWVLSLDSDESINDELRESIRSAISANDPTIAGYAMNRRTWIGERELRHTWQPEWKTRLARRLQCRWEGDYHERLEVDGRVERLPGVLRHDAFQDAAHLRQKQEQHGRQAADVYFVDGQRSNLLKLWTSPMAAVFKQLVLRGAWLDGRAGWQAAMSTGLSAATKHRRLLELAQREQHEHIHAHE